MAQLRNIPLHELKIDKSFIQQIGDDKLNDASITGFAVACFVFVVGVAVGAYVCVRRRRCHDDEAAARRRSAEKTADAVDTRQITLL